MTTGRVLPLILEVQRLARTSLFEIEARRVRFPNGVERQLERLKTKLSQTVLMVPLLHNEFILLVREYCVGTNTYELVFPTGTVGPDETVEDAVLRELKEEVGFGAGRIALLPSVRSFPGHLNHETHMFLADDLYSEKLLGDEPQPLEAVRWPISDLSGLINTKEFREVRSIAALLLLERFLTGAE